MQFSGHKPQSSLECMPFEIIIILFLGQAVKQCFWEEFMQSMRSDYYEYDNIISIDLPCHMVLVIVLHTIHDGAYV